MTFNSYYIFLFLSLLFIISYAELEMVHVILRHGDRAPSFTYPLDTEFNVDEYFPHGFSQLTNRGFEQSKELGSFLRDRYSFLLDTFNRKEALIRSSDKDRCIETAMGLTTTLFPSQIVPVHTYSHYKDDLLLKPNSVSCPKADQIVEKDKLEIFQQINEEYQEFFNFLSIKTGWNINAQNIQDVYNVLYRMKSNNVPQPSWVTQNIPFTKNETTIDIVIELKRIVRNLSFNSGEKSKLRTGYLLGQIINDMSDRIRRVSQRKMIVYSTHDATVTSLMYSLGISNDQLPPYTAALLIEMHRIEGKRYVQILYRNSTINEPYEMIIPGCNGLSLCSWSKFRHSLESKIIKNREEHQELCELKEDILSSTPIIDDIEEDRTSTYFTVGFLSILDFLTMWKQKA